MANWSDLKAAVALIVKTNGNKEITGQLLQNVLNNIISNVGLNSSFAGIATPETNPGTPDGNVFYLATTAGTYSNFNGIVINSGEAVILEWKGSWVKKDSGFATKEKLSELGSKYSITGTYKNNEVQIDTLYWIEGEKYHTEWKRLSVNQTFTFGNFGGSSEVLILKEDNTLELKSANDAFNGIVLLLWARSYNDYFGGVLYDEYLVKKIEGLDDKMNGKIEDLNGKMEDNAKTHLKNQYIYSISGNYTNKTIQIDTLYYTDIEKKNWGRVNVNNTFTFGELNISSEFLVLGKNNEVLIKPNNTINSDDIVLLAWGRGFDDFYDGKLYGEYSFYKMEKIQASKLYSITGTYKNNEVQIDTLYWIEDKKNYAEWKNLSVNQTFTFGNFGGSSEVLILKEDNTLELKSANDTFNGIILLLWARSYNDYFGGVLYDEYLCLKKSGGGNNEEQTFTSSECIERFVKEMNKVAQIVGMNDSLFYEPAGYPNTRNTTTAHDLMKLGIYASGIYAINNAWGKRTAKISILGTNSREIDLTGPSDSNFESSYNILGWKPGQSTVYKTNTWIMVVQSKNTNKIYVVGEYNLDNNASTFDYNLIKEALDYVDAGSEIPTYTQGAICICELPNQTPSLFSNQSIEMLYSYNEDVVFDQASTTKVMTLLVASMQYVSPNERVTLISSDIQSGTGVELKSGDIISVGDLFLLGMLPSSNTAMYALARHIGKKLLSLEA